MSELDLYDYHLPDESIARHPAAERDAARLLVLRRDTGAIAHHTIRDLPALLRPGDCLVLNDTRVLPARLLGYRTATGGRWEGLYLESPAPGTWRVMGRTRGKLQPGERITLTPVHAPTAAERLELTLVEADAEGIWSVRVESPDVPEVLLERFGTVPLPPYIERDLATEEDRRRYQTLYARRPGAVAAPTAGLHFTPELLAACQARGIEHAFVTLHVGIGTFRPIAVENLREHRMHREWCELSEETARVLRDTRRRGGKIVAVGTTTVRTLETAAAAGEIRAWRGETDLLIRPPHHFQAEDAILTNFHLPRSSLLVMLSAFAGRAQILAAYHTAVRAGYRFYSFGDAMLILPGAHCG